MQTVGQLIARLAREDPQRKIRYLLMDNSVKGRKKWTIVFMR
jgi:hypothetical protein